MAEGDVPGRGSELVGPGVSPEAIANGSDIAGSEREHSREVLAMARQGGLNFSGAIFNQGLRFAITFFLARLLGPREAGLYYQSFAFLAFTGLLAAGGFALTLTRFVAVHRADGDEGALRGTVRLGLATPTLTAFGAGALLYVFAPWLGDSAFGDPEMSELLRFVAFALPATVFTDVALSATQGYKTMKQSALINLFFEPACRITLTLLFLWAGWGLPGVMTALVITNWTAAVLASIALRRLMGRLRATPRYNMRELLAFSTASWFSNLASNGLIWADTVLLGILGTATEVGIYQVATRLTLLASVFVQPVTNSFAPRIADLWRRERYEILRKTYALITGWVFRLSLPPFIILLLFPRELLAIFGGDFQKGATVTILLTIAGVVNSATGPSGYMLTMSGNPRKQLANNIAALVLNVALNLLLIPPFGILGAAISWSTSIMVVSLARVAQVYSFSRMLPFSRDLLKGLGAGLAAAAAGIAIATAMEGVVSLLLGAAVVGIVYLGAITFIGIDSDDRLVLAALRQRLRPRRV